MASKGLLTRGPGARDEGRETSSWASAGPTLSLHLCDESRMNPHDSKGPAPVGLGGVPRNGDCETQAPGHTHLGRER